MPPMSPKRSAVARNARGSTRPPPSSRMRSRISCWVVSPRFRSTMGWAVRTNSPLSVAWRTRSVQMRRSSESLRSVLNARTRSRPASLAACMAASASARSSAPMTGRSSREVTPALSEIRSGSPAITNACFRVRSSSSAATATAFVLSAPWTRIPNTSPPTRARTSVLRRRPRITFDELDQQPIAGSRPQRLVDVLEGVDAEREHAAPVAVAGRVVDVSGERMLEARAVRQSRQGVLIGHLLQARLCPLPFAYVARHGGE